MKKIVSFLLVLVLVFGSFSFAFSASEQKTFYGLFSGKAFSRSEVLNFRTPLASGVPSKKYTFQESLDLFLADCDDVGYYQNITKDDVFLLYNPGKDMYEVCYGQTYYDAFASVANFVTGLWAVVNKSGATWDLTNYDDYYEQFKSDFGYYAWWSPENSKFYFSTDAMGNHIVSNYHVKDSNGSELNPDGQSNSLYSPKDFYIDYDRISESVAQGVKDALSEVDFKQATSGQTDKHSILSDNNITLPEQTFSIGDGTFLAYSPTNNTYYTYDYDYEYNYTITNNYSYSYVNYYMPGSDEPFQASEIYYELPDGRSSADLTFDEIQGLNLGFDCVNYTQVAVDPYQQALFHFDGTIDNDGVSNPLDYVTSTISSEHYVVSSNRQSFDIPIFPCKLHLSSSGSNIHLIYGDDNFVIYNGIVRGEMTFDIVSGHSDHIYFTSVTNPVEFYFTWDSNEFVPSTSIVDSDLPNFKYTVGASYTFVDTGSQYFLDALYLDGNQHDFTINLATGSVISMFDYTYTFRWYQELSTDTKINNIWIGGGNVSNCDCMIRFNGIKIDRISNRGQTLDIDVSIPVGIWNTISVVRSGTNILLFMNGLLVAQLNNSTVPSTSPYSDVIKWHLANNGLVRYLDEMMFTDIALYTSDFVPRFQPYDSGVALVLPQDITSNTLAIHSNIPVSKYQFGGVRSTIPVQGEVYVYIENNQIKSIQQWNGYMWFEVSGMVYYSGHWYSLQSFTIGTIGSQYDGNQDISSGGGSTQDQEKQDVNFLNLIYKLLSGVIDLIVKLFNSFVDLVDRIFSAIGNLISKLLEGIGNFTFDLSPVESVSTGFWSVLPSWFKGFFTSAFTILIAIAVFAIFK